MALNAIVGWCSNEVSRTTVETSCAGGGEWVRQRPGCAAMLRLRRRYTGLLHALPASREHKAQLALLVVIKFVAARGEFRFDLFEGGVLSCIKQALL